MGVRQPACQRDCDPLRTQSPEERRLHQACKGGLKWIVFLSALTQMLLYFARFLVFHCVTVLPELSPEFPPATPSPAYPPPSPTSLLNPLVCTAIDTTGDETGGSPHAACTSINRLQLSRGSQRGRLTDSLGRNISVRVKTCRLFLVSIRK